VFSQIQVIDDVRPHVAHKKEIRFSTHPGGVTVACYQFMDSHTFDSDLAKECRGLAFDASGRVCSRPLHKFFNVGEKEQLTAAALSKRSDLVAVFEKLDGSMLATAWVNGELQWRSKKSFTSDVVALTTKFLTGPEQAGVVAFATEVARQGLTAIFELTHPEARIVVASERPELKLLHVRDNVSGAYVLLQPEHPIHELIARYQVPLAPRYPGMRVSDCLEAVTSMTEREGFVLQFADGDMVKLKCPWYLQLHRSITFLRERDIALAALTETLDDIKSALAEAGIDLKPVEEVETRVLTELLTIEQEVQALVSTDQGLGRKEFAIKHQKHPLFGLAMMQFSGKPLDIKEWFIKSRLKQTFSLRVLADGALAEALEG